MGDTDFTVTVPKNRAEEVRAGLSHYGKAQLIDVRVFAAYGDKPATERGPTKKGVSLDVARLPELIEALQTVAQEALRRGLIAVPHEQPRPWWDRD